MSMRAEKHAAPNMYVQACEGGQTDNFSFDNVNNIYSLPWCNEA